MSAPAHLCIYIIYDSPPGYAGKVVVRRVWIGTHAHHPAQVSVFDDLDSARRFVPPSFARADPPSKDLPTVVEVWV